MKKPLLVFDFFGVVVGEVAHKWLHENMSKEESTKIINTLFVSVDDGRITPNDCFNALSELTKVPAKDIEKAWIKNGFLRTDTYKFLTENKHKYHIVLLSNAGKSFVDKFFDMYNIDHFFMKKYISSELKMAKPDAKIFQYVLDDNAGSFDIAVMIDDSEKNIINAKKVGMEGIVYTSMDQTESELERIFSK